MRRLLTALAVLSLLAAACVAQPPPGDNPPPAEGGDQDPAPPPGDGTPNPADPAAPPTAEQPPDQPALSEEPSAHDSAPRWLVGLRAWLASVAAARESQTRSEPAGTPGDETSEDPGPPEVAAAVAPAAIPLPGNCNPLGLGDDTDPDDPHSCALPWPSDLFRDPSGKLQIPDSVIAADVVGEYPTSASPSAIFDGADGFSSVSPVLFELEAPVDASSLPPDGAGVLVVHDLTAGGTVPVLVALDPGAPNGPTENAGTVVRAWPRTRWEFGHRYLAVLTTALGSAGAPYTRTPGVEEAVAGPGTPLGDHYDPLLTAAGIDRQTVLSLTDFTARSESDAVGNLESMIATTDSQAHPVTIDEVTSPLGYPWCFLGLACPGIDTIVLGHVQLTDFRDPRTGDIHGYQAGDQGTPQSVPFVLAIPHAAASTPVPVAIYGHGLGVIKETFLAAVLANGPAGIATITIDQPNHGERVVEGDPNHQHIFDLLEPADFGRASSIPLQSDVDHASLLRAVETELADLDAAPTPLFGEGGDGVADLDTSRILYEGTSLGGVLGAGFVAAHPRVDGAFVQVAGNGIIHILSESTFWDQEGACFGCIVSQDASLADAAALTAFAQQVVDPGEPSNLTPRLAADGRPFDLVYAHGDTVVPNFSSERLAALAGLPLYGPVQYAIPWLPAPLPEQPENGRGAFQIDPKEGIFGILDAHISFLNRSPMAEFNAWLAAHFPVDIPPSTETAALTVTNATEPAGGTGFEFRVDDGDPFTLDDGDSETFEDLEVGEHTVVESDPGDDWELTEIACKIDGENAGVLDPRAGTVALDLEADDEAVCTFSNGGVTVEDTPAEESPDDTPSAPAAEQPADDANVAGNQVTSEASGGGLPFTGLLGGWLLPLGLALLAGGLVLVLGTRARRATGTPPS